MKARRPVIRAAGTSVALLLLMLTASGRSESATASKIEPGAQHLLAAATDYLKGQSSLSFTAEIRYDDVQPGGLKYQVNGLAKYVVSRPGNLFVDYTGDRRSANFYSNGKVFAFYDRLANVYGTAPATDNNDTTLSTIFTKYDFTVPLDDVVSNDPGKSFMAKVLNGYDLGPSLVEGSATRHLLFTQSDINWQIWIDSSGPPIIRELSITYKNLPAEPQYTAIFHDWKFDPIDASVFTFLPPAGAVHVELVAVPNGGAK